jgi:hypothetical protein
MVALSVMVLAAQLISSTVPIADVCGKVRQHGWGLLAAWSLVGLAQHQLHINKSLNLPTHAVALYAEVTCAKSHVNASQMKCPDGPTAVRPLQWPGKACTCTYTRGPRHLRLSARPRPAQCLTPSRSRSPRAQALEMLLSAASLWLAARWLRGSTPSLHRAVRLAMVQQSLACVHLLTHVVGGTSSHLTFVFLVLEAAMLMLSGWRAWTAGLLLPVFGTSARLLLANSLLEVRGAHVHRCRVYRLLS